MCERKKEQIPCWGAAPERCLAGPLGASVHQQLLPAAARHPGEEDKQIPSCVLGCLFMTKKKKKKKNKQGPWLPFYVFFVGTRFTQSELFICNDFAMFQRPSK